ncbi:DEAD/DEAH box helicase [Hyalangium sp.]|uniref:DEAD/DEAH box helicase n=1 Tax=Hyalangium sp. TaxID=2028555 RepID=UPI002D68CD45|nr:DEAD/DEAH box helicase [Hyalangium sp.]HYI01660.1 DEAD/DEAH box helicase [Hyalangium sp.]
MVDFRKRLGGGSGKQPLDPLEIYNGLDRASDKGELRRAQEAVLKEWHSKARAKKDVIVKLHTGQGKTLIGLLVLQSKINEKLGPALYLCPDNFLVEQTALQAQQFGFNCETIGGGDELPANFIEGKSILITSVQKVFNGLTKFGLHGRATKVGAVVIDDVHACINSIRDACTIRLSRGSQAYSDLVNLFSSSLESQGQGSYADLVNGVYEALLPVPYWDWIDRTSDIAKILSSHSASKEIKFAWPLIKDVLADCECLVSGTSLEIFPRLPPLATFGSYDQAKHRVFMSATISDDSFLIKGMGISPDTVQNPLSFTEKWSGEKMVLIPSLLSEELDRSAIVARFGKPASGRKYGVVALTPSFKGSVDWQKYGAVTADTDTIYDQVKGLREGDCEVPLVVANRYDGIDLPDNSCRVLILDSRPYGESLYERHLERCLPNTEAVAVRVARTIEQGMGRSVRGEKDYSVVLLIGTSLVRFVRMPDSRAYLSPQTRQQIEIGLDVAGFAQEDLEKGMQPEAVLNTLLSQCLKRDDGWKAYYIEHMDKLADPAAAPKRLEIFALELKAEVAALERRYEDAANITQQLSDKHVSTEAEKGWYLQEMARHLYRSSKVKSQEMQTTAHRKNHFLLLPNSSSAKVPQLPFAQKRVEKVIDWLKKHEDPSALTVSIEALLSDLRFGVDAEVFEAAFHRLGEALGFACERPDKEWKEGPDNLWRIRDNHCLIVECKSEVKVERAEIEKRESEQMNRSAAWFIKHYPGVIAECVLVIPPKKLASAAALLQPTTVLQKKGLDKLVANVRAFFGEFFTQDLQNLSERNVGQALERHQLGVDHLLRAYTVQAQGGGLPHA